MNLIQKWALADALTKLHADPSLLKTDVLGPDITRIAAKELLEGVCKLNQNGDAKDLPVTSGNFASIVLRRAMRMAALELRRSARHFELVAP